MTCFHIVNVVEKWLNSIVYHISTSPATDMLHGYNVPISEASVPKRWILRIINLMMVPIAQM